MKLDVLGIDLGKTVFHLEAIWLAGGPAIKKTSRELVRSKQNGSEFRQLLRRARLLPAQRRQFQIGGVFQVHPGVLFCSLLSLLNVVNGFGRRDPALRVDIVNGHLHTLRIAL